MEDIIEGDGRPKWNFTSDQYFVPNKKNWFFHQKGSSLSYLYWNLGENNADWQKDVENLLTEHKPSVLFLTNLDQKSVGTLASSRGYQCLRKEADRGLFVFVKAGLEFLRLNECEGGDRMPVMVLKVVEKNFFLSADEISLQDKVTVLVCVLGEELQDEEGTPSLEDIVRATVKAVQTAAVLYPGAPCIVQGTLEVHNQEWVQDEMKTDELGELLRIELTGLGLVPKQREATWFPTVDSTGSCVDYTICSEPLRCQVDLLRWVPLISDHKPVLLQQDRTYCSVCLLGFTYTSQLNQHVETNKHRTNQCFRMYQIRRTKYLKSPHELGLQMSIAEASQGVSLSDTEPGVVEVLATELQQKTFELILKNSGQVTATNLENKKDFTKDQGLVIEQISLLRPNGTISLRDDNQLTQGGNRKIRLLDDRSYKVDVICMGDQVGRHRVVLMVLFYHEIFSAKDERTGRFKLDQMALEINFTVSHPELQGIGPISPYEKPVPFKTWRVQETVPGIRPTFAGGQRRTVSPLKLDQYTITKTRKVIVQNGLQPRNDSDVSEAALYQHLLREPLSTSTYTQRFQLLLHCEELQMEHDIRHYDMTGVPVELERGMIKIKVPGLAENRPSVLKGDRMFIKEAGSTSKDYEGYVTDIGENYVYLKVHEGLISRYIRKMCFDVRFTINRFPLRTMHRAVELIQSEGVLPSLFPVRSAAVMPAVQMRDILPYNRLIESNGPQLTAVRSIVSRTSGDLPYIIFGPPGTGKTITVVESIKQVVKLNPEARIIATAPSNSAADLLAERLKEHLVKGKLIRLHADSRNLKTINPKVLDISNVNVSNEIEMKTQEELIRYQVVVVTLVNAGRLASLQFPDHHFTHVFIDECGHATEPEACIPMAGILSSNTLKTKGQIVLAGDPKQLGPVLMSAHTKNNRLDISLLERLMERALYKPNSDGAYPTEYITKLVKNFRSHEAILTLPSRLYYNNDLITSGDPALINSMLQFPGLPDRAKGKFPIIFHGVIGEDQQEANSPSFFNPQEIVIVLQYVKELLELKANRIKPEEIGIITPYRKHVQKLREKLKSKGPEYQRITVGSTEEFQGQERRVIIISCVRSKPQYVKMDNQYKLGFLKNSKRFNVAITRAKALMIIIGNPHILGQDKDWRAMLDYVEENGGYKGCEYSTSNTELDRLEQQLSRLMVADAAELRSATVLYE